MGSRWRKMIFGLCFFHAIVLERKKFGPLGWNILYEFSESDRECALLNLDLYCQKGRFGIPWEALQYITGEITYGGRVTDIWDQRTLKTILKGFFSPASLMDGYKYSPSGIYFCPESDICNNLESYRYFIENMPLLEEPEIFGMHENANLTFQSKETAYILITIMEIQPKESSIKEGKSSDEIVSDLSEFIKSSIDSKIMDDEVFPLHVKQDETGRVPPLSTVLFQEIDRFNKLLRIIHTSLNDLLKAIKGFVVMSDALEEIYKSFLNNTVPKLWNRSAYPSLKPLGSWTHDLQLRLDFINFWKRSGSPSSFWLPGLFFPQGFMTGVLQTSARKNSFPIDRLKIDFYVQKALIDQEDVRRFHLKYNKDVVETYKGLKPPSDGVFIHGLFLDAARFDMSKMLLTDPNPGEINPKLPVLALKPVKYGVQPANRYEAPLYKTSIRAGVLSTTGHSTNFVIAVLLPTDKPQSYWILKGTALLTQISE